MNYIFSKTSAELDPEKLWKNIELGLSKNVILKSLKQEKLYTVKSIDSNTISYTSPERSEGKEEQIHKTDFVELIKRLQKLDSFNSSTAKDLFPSDIYRKRSPIFAILVSATIIEPIK